MTKRIEDYGLIADGETAALVGRDGTIEWLCMPRFDSDACFSSLLGDEDNGCWRLAPEGEVQETSRRYIDDTMIIETVFATADGEVAVIDFMPIRGEAPDVVRIVEGRAGSVAMRSRLAPRFDYGQLHPLVRHRSDREALAIAGPNALALRFDVPIDAGDRWFESRFTVREGERLCFTMTWFASNGDVPKRVDAMDELAGARRYWTEWAAGADYRGPYRDRVIRSLLTLKALIHMPTGGIVAAPTASLPEQPGGPRNWDYRFCWLRDATFTLLAFLQSGLTDEATAWAKWLRRAIAGQPIDVRPFYTVDGARRIPEWEADWLSGFNGARPVRFGNGAVGQLQLDVYGEVLDALWVACRESIDDDNSALVTMLADRLETIWREPDAGIWESRGDPQHHTYSKAMCWVAFDRAARWFEKDRDRSGRYRTLADAAKAAVLDRGFNARLNSFTGTFDGDTLDAAVLLLPHVGFIEANDPRMIGTVAAVEKHLMRDGFVRRYQPDAVDDGVGGDEGAFLACSFWLADVYVLQGRTDGARALFDRLCGVSNDLGLLAEEVGIGDRRMRGNFPQALSHLSLVGTAMNLSSGGGPALARSGAPDGDGAGPE